MRSSNPVFTRSQAFNGTANAYATYPGNADPSTWGTGTPGTPGLVEDGGRMSIDSVVQKSALTFGIVLLTAAITWWWIGDLSGVVSDSALGRLYGASLVGSGLAFGLSLVNSFKQAISPALVLAFAAAEGVALGALSKFFDARFDGNIVMQAVIGTFAAFAGTLAAYKFFDIKVGNRFRKGVVAAMFGMVGLGLLEMVLGFFGKQLGFFGFSGLGLAFSVVGLVLGVFMLLLDFDFVEQGVAAGLPERESWRAAFGLTVSLVWIYTNLLRILAILRGD